MRLKVESSVCAAVKLNCSCVCVCLIANKINLRFGAFLVFRLIPVCLCVCVLIVFLLSARSQWRQRDCNRRMKSAVLCLPRLKSALDFCSLYSDLFVCFCVVFVLSPLSHLLTCPVTHYLFLALWLAGLFEIEEGGRWRFSRRGFPAGSVYVGGSGPVGGNVPARVQ